MDKKALIGLIAFLNFPFIMKLIPASYMWSEIMFWLLLVGIILWVYLVEKRTLASIGWKKLTTKLTLIAIGLGLVLFVVFGLATTAIRAVGLELNQDVAQMIAGKPWPVLILLALRAAIVEEVLFRGYSFERILELTGSKWIAGLIPLICFMLVHLSWGVGHLLFILIAGGMLTCMYAAKRNLAVNIIAHLVVDIIALLAMPMMVEA